MKTNAFFFHANGEYALDVRSLTGACQREGFHVQDLGDVDDQDRFRDALPKKPAILFLPAVEEDCLGVKLAQKALMDAPPLVFNGPPRVIVLYAPSLPGKEFLCLAFREGVDDVLALDSGEQALDVQIKRAGRMLQTRLDSSFSGGELEGKIHALHAQCERLERTSARWKEKYLALASASVRLAAGELRLEKLAPPLLIAATSASQASSAEELAQRLGFDVQVAYTGADALASIKKRPPRVILTDGTLPDMDGQTLALSARKILGAEPAVVIAWSSSPAAQDALLAPETGIDDFVLKSASSEAADLLAASLLGALR